MSKGKSGQALTKTLVKDRPHFFFKDGEQRYCCFGCVLNFFIQYNFENTATKSVFFLFQKYANEYNQCKLYYPDSVIRFANNISNHGKIF